MSEERNRNLSINDRARLLTELLRTQPNQSANAKEALRILNSLQRHAPRTPGVGAFTNNPVAGVTGSISPRGSVDFMVDGTFQNPKQAHSTMKRLAINAAVNQLINEIPPINELPKGSSRSQSGYSFKPMSDGGDFQSTVRNNWEPRNRRALLYKKLTGGAFQAHPRQDGSFAGGGIRRGETTWQPRGPGGRYSNNVEHDPKTPVRRLGKIVKEDKKTLGPRWEMPQKLANRQLPHQTLSSILAATKRLNTLTIANDIVKGFTGKGYDDWFRDTVESATDKLNKGEAWKPTGYTPSVGPMY